MLLHFRHVLQDHLVHFERANRLQRNLAYLELRALDRKDANVPAMISKYAVCISTEHTSLLLRLERVMLQLSCRVG